LSKSEDAPKRTVTIDTETPGTEIFIIDANGTVVARSVRTLECQLPPGLYKIRYRVGDYVTDKLEEIPVGQGEFRISTPELPIITPAPLPTAGDTSELTPAKFAAEVSRNADMHQGSGGSLFIFVRADNDEKLDNPASGLSLHTFDGALIGDFAGAHQSRLCSGCTIELNPANYLLRARVSGLPIEQTVVISPGWQTQVYIRLADKLGPRALSERVASESGAYTNDSADRWQFQLSESGVMLVRDDSRKQPTAMDIRWTAAARQALTAGRSRAAPNREMMSALLSGKFENPMLGIYAGHLLALQENPDMDLLREVVDNLLRLVGYDHPDVTSLLIYLRDPRSAGRYYREPPMLRASWSILVNASTAENDLRAPRSYASRIGASLWGAGPWLIWRTPPAEQDQREPSNTSDAPLQALIQQAVIGKLEPELDALARARKLACELTPTERVLAQCLISAAKQIKLAKELTADADRRKTFSFVYQISRFAVDSQLLKDTKATVAETFTPDRLTRLTALPYSTVLDAASTLAQKLASHSTG